MTLTQRPDLDTELAGLALVETDARRLLDEPAARLHAVDERISRWSAAQQIEHALRVDVVVFTDIEAALAGRPCVTTDAGLTRGGEMVLRTGAIPRGVADTPGVFRPAPQPEIAALRRLLDEHAAARKRLAAAREAVAASAVRIAHFALGGMTPAQWVRFGRIHLTHHLAIARELVEEPNSPDA